jgi:hypothetical protein
MQRSWVLALMVASGLLAQTPPTVPPQVPVSAPAPGPQSEKAQADVPPVPKQDEPKPAEAQAPASASFDQLRPTQRKLAYTLNRAALSAHELGYYRSHPRVLEVREALEALVGAKPGLPEKAQAALPATEAYLLKLYSNHGLYDAEGKKLLLEGTWKDLRTAARAAAKTGPKDLEARLLKLKGLLYDPKVDAAAPSWAEPEAAAKGKKAKARKAPRVPAGFTTQKAITALWVKRAQAWIENTPQEVEVKGEKKLLRLPEPVQTKALNDLLAWLDGDDLLLLRDPGFPWLDLRRLGAVPGAGLLAKAADIAASKAPEGPAGELTLLPTYEPVLGESRFVKGDEKRMVLAEVKQGPAPATLTEQMDTFEKLARSRDFDAK